jgi:hypothetical protein
MQKMLGTEHGGMNEVLANLYGLTGDEKYLKIAQRFNHMAVLGPASRREDKLTGLHANTQIPKFIGTARQYELTGQEWLKTASTFFWDTVVKERSYVIGGHSDGEMFSPKEKLSEALGPNTTETCNTYNVLRLTRHLFCWDPKAEYADYYERALYNHILASQNPVTGMMCYYVPLRSGSNKVYNTPYDSFWCCTGTGIENHAKYGDSIYFHNDTTLWVNLFISSELNWRTKGLKVCQETRYPDEAASRLVFTADKPLELSLKIRHPYWASSGFEVKVNGERVASSSTPGSYATVSRMWRTGDTVVMVMPFHLHNEGFRDNPKRQAFMHGPLVLCAEVAKANPLPVVVTEGGMVLDSSTAMPGKPSTFRGSPDVFRFVGEDAAWPVVLDPFYKVHDERRYVVYWDLLTPAQWQARQDEYRAELARQTELDARTVDRVSVGDRQSERDHELRGQKSGAGTFGGRMWRHATEGGWFSYRLKVVPDQPQELRITYWGSDAGRREFDILVDGERVATQRLENNRPDQFYDETYPLPKTLVENKTSVTVRLHAHPGMTAGGIFGCGILKPEN